MVEETYKVPFPVYKSITMQNKIYSPCTKCLNLVIFK